MKRHYLKTQWIILLFCLVFSNHLQAQKYKLPSLGTFVSDTLYIEVAQDSTLAVSAGKMEIIDSRSLDESILGIQQTKKFRYIPVDQYLAMDQSLSKLFRSQFVSDSLEISGTLHISNLILWTDNQQFLEKGLRLNAYTTYHDTLGQAISDWIWEINLKKKRKQAEADYLAGLVKELLEQQSTALATHDFNPVFYPHIFRRQLMTWSEFIFFSDGYAINTHLTLDFPPDQESTWKRGSPGLFYRKSSIHESIAIGGKDQQWYRRLSSGWITKGSTTFRFGFNNFEGSHFEHLDYQNLLYVNISGQASIEYRPVYHKGLYGGLGFYVGYNILPDVIPQAGLGLLFSVGLLLP